MAMWIPMHRFIPITAIAGDDGRIIADNTPGIIAELVATWAPVFQEKAIDVDMAQRILGDAGNLTSWNWQAYRSPSDVQIKRELEFSSDSAPGPDGLPYSAWKASEFAVMLLDAVDNAATSKWIPSPSDPSVHAGGTDVLGLTDVAQVNVQKKDVRAYRGGVAVQ
eukprot:7836503-Karenia_brevis.AAC.1